MKIFLSSLILSLSILTSAADCSPETLARLSVVRPAHLEELQGGDLVSFIDRRTGKRVSAYYAGKIGKEAFFSSRPLTEAERAQQFTLIPPEDIVDLRFSNPPGQIQSAAPGSLGGFSIGQQVKVPRSNGGESVGNVVEVDPDRGLVKVAFVDSSRPTALASKWISPSDLTKVNLDSVYEFSSRIVGNYVSASGDVVEVNPESRALQEQMQLALRRMQDNGARPHTRRTRPTEEELRNVSKAWLGQSGNIEQTRPISAAQLRYGEKRARVVNNGVADLGEIAACKAAVCRELSLFGSLALSELGYRTRVGRGNVVETSPLGRKKVVGAHAWVEFLDPQSGEVIGVLDSNYQERFYADRSQYFREANIDPDSVTQTVIAEPAAWQ